MYKSSKDPSLICDLLRFAAASSNRAATENTVSRLVFQPDEAQLRQVIAAGMAPLLYHAIGDRIDHWPADWRPVLKGADWSARVRHGAQIDTAVEVVDTCLRLGVRPTLLKGISISERHYPEAHLRLMGDIDILVPSDSRQLVEAAMLKQGYLPQAQDYPVNEYSHHGAPLRHPKLGVWVEIHSALFRRNSPWGKTGVFARKALSEHLVAGEFQGRQVNRLSEELQLVYLASSWVKDQGVGFHPSLLVVLFDAIYLLHQSGQQPVWEGLADRVDNEPSIASLYLLLTYLQRHRLWSPREGLLSDLAGSQHTLGFIELLILHAMLDRYLLRGNPFPRLIHSSHLWRELMTTGPALLKLARLPWRIAFPPKSPDRFTVGFQRERISRLVSRFQPR